MTDSDSSWLCGQSIPNNESCGLRNDGQGNERMSCAVSKPRLVSIDKYLATSWAMRRATDIQSSERKVTV